MPADQAIILAYMEANKRVLSTATDGQQIPLPILNTFLGVAHWGLDNPNHKEPNTLEYLADKLGITPQTVSEHTRYLGDKYRKDKVGLGLVTTEIYAPNRRMKTFRLTQKGKATVNSIINILGGARA